MRDLNCIAKNLIKTDSDFEKTIYILLIIIKLVISTYLEFELIYYSIARCVDNDHISEYFNYRLNNFVLDAVTIKRLGIYIHD